MLSITQAQQDMRYGYFGGGVGMFVSGSVWLVSGIIASIGYPDRAIWALLIGGAFIHPVSLLLIKLMGRPATFTPGNPLGALALEGTVWMILCLPLTYAISQTHPQWFYPAMLLVIGGRYLTFSTLYGLRTYWLCGALLVVAGWVLVTLKAPFVAGPFTGALIEIVLSPVLFMAGRKEGKP